MSLMEHAQTLLHIYRLRLALAVDGLHVEQRLDILGIQRLGHFEQVFYVAISVTHFVSFLILIRQTCNLGYAFTMCFFTVLMLIFISSATSRYFFSSK